MTTKLDRDAASDEKMLSSNSHDPLITWTDQVTWKKKTLYLHFHETYGYKSKQDEGIW